MKHKNKYFTKVHNDRLFLLLQNWIDEVNTLNQFQRFPRICSWLESILPQSPAFIFGRSDSSWSSTW